MSPITEVHWALWYGLVYCVAIAGAWLIVTVLWIVGRRRPPPPAAPLKAEPPDLEHDPELHRFFARVNHAYRRRPPPHVEAPLPGTAPLLRPQLIRERGDPAPIAEKPAPEPYSIHADPFVLHSGPFHSPREEKPPELRTASKPKVSVDDTAPRPAQPKPSAPADPGPTEQELIVMVNIWAQLSPKDRHELLALARIKAGLDK